MPRIRKNKEKAFHNETDNFFSRMMQSVARNKCIKTESGYNAEVLIPTDGEAVEIPIPEGFQGFISEEGKLMIRKKDIRQPITYKELVKSLYSGNDNTYFLESANDTIFTYACRKEYANSGNCMSEAQVKRIQAFNKMQNIARYLNKGWKPDFNDNTSKKWFIACDNGIYYNVYFNNDCMGSGVYFKSRELAEQAILIMGKDSLADLFTTKWY